MPQKATKKSTISNSRKKSNTKMDVETKTSTNNLKKSNQTDKEDSKQKVVIKRRKKDLTPTKASATAIISQANCAKKQALIEKIAEKQIQPTVKEDQKVSSAKVPLWVRILFGCSLFLFCVSFYHAIIRPQLEPEVENISTEKNIYWNSDSENDRLVWEVELPDMDSNTEISINEEIIENPQNAEELIQSFFAYMSNEKFDKSFSLFDTRAQKDSNIRQYFGELKMAPFFQWIEWKSIKPQNIQKTTDTYKWKDVYTFDISYILASTHEQYDETWEFVAGETNWEWKIFRIYCITNQCSRHPIFWPENFGMM